MPSIRRETGRHKWKEGMILTRGPERIPGSKLCMNCRKPWYGDQYGSPPVAGCPIEVDLTKASDARLAEQRNYEMAQRYSNEEAERRMAREE